MSRANQTSACMTPPRTDEYLPEAIRKAVVQTGIKHPGTIYPISMGISAGVVGALFNIPLLMGAALGLALIGPAWAVLQIFFRHELLGSRYLESLHHRQKQYEVHLIGNIEAGLKACARTKGLKPMASTAITQLKSIRIKLANVQELLGMKLHTNEISYGRFLGAAEQVSMSVMDNLNAVVSILKSAASIDPDYVRTRLQELTAKQGSGSEERDQQKSLQERLDLWNSQLKKVNKLIARNEEAMTEMERISAEIAQWQTDRKFSGSDFESAIKQLHALALQAKEYNKL
jgi:hypothetical protein